MQANIGNDLATPVMIKGGNLQRPEKALAAWDLKNTAHGFIVGKSDIHTRPGVCFGVGVGGGQKAHTADQSSWCVPFTAQNSTLPLLQTSRIALDRPEYRKSYMRPSSARC